MIVKQRNGKLSSNTLYGVAGGVFGIVTIGLMINSQLAPETYPSCSTRYSQAGMFALKRTTGALLQPAELQSKLGGREWGVLHNIAVANDANAPLKAAMTVKLKAGGRIDRSARTATSGVGFNWQPGYLNKASAACLSYSVRLPERFKFGGGGTLPGLFGTSALMPSNGKEAFSMRMRWLQGGRVGVQPVTASKPKGLLLPLNEKRLRMPRGQWVQVEQEVVLNTPGQSDGAMRIWIDGQLQQNIGGLSFRKDDRSKFAGVIADTHYAGHSMDWKAAPASTEIKISPLIVRWN
jgi:Polysaccharide lyase 14